MGDSCTRRAIVEDGVPVHLFEPGTDVYLLFPLSFWVSRGGGCSERDDSVGDFANMSCYFVCIFDEEKLSRGRIANLFLL